MQFPPLTAIRFPFSAPRFNEFVVRGPRPAVETLERLRTCEGILGGLALSKYYGGHDNDFLVCVTEMTSRAQIDQLADAIANA